MYKSKIFLFTVGVSILIASQWLSHYWFSQNLLTAYKEESSLSFQRDKHFSRVDVSTSPKNSPSIGTLELSHIIAPIIEREVRRALMKVDVRPDKEKMLFDEKTPSNVQNSIVDDNAESFTSEEAYNRALDIVMGAQVSGNWDESVHIQLMDYRDKMTHKQKQKIIDEYMKAFNAGSIGYGVPPPF